jgi:hypothetical protein
MATAKVNKSERFKADVGHTKPPRRPAASPHRKKKKKESK